MSDYAEPAYERDGSIAAIVTQVREDINEMKKTWDVTPPTAGEPFNFQSATRVLENDLTHLHDAIVTMSQICIDRLGGIYEDLNKMSTEVQEVDGVLAVIKDSSGAVFLDDSARGQVLPQQKPKLESFKPKAYSDYLFFPSSGVTINMNTLNGIGATANELAQGEGIDKLIVPTSQSPKQKPWSKREDYFVMTRELEQASLARRASAPSAATPVASVRRPTQ